MQICPKHCTTRENSMVEKIFFFNGNGRKEIVPVISTHLLQCIEEIVESIPKSTPLKRPSEFWGFKQWTPEMWL